MSEEGSKPEPKPRDPNAALRKVAAKFASYGEIEQTVALVETVYRLGFMEGQNAIMLRWADAALAAQEKL